MRGLAAFRRLGQRELWFALALLVFVQVGLGPGLHAIVHADECCPKASSTQVKPDANVDEQDCPFVKVAQQSVATLTGTPTVVLAVSVVAPSRFSTPARALRGLAVERPGRSPPSNS